jgi:hypothetical protein
MRQAAAKRSVRRIAFLLGTFGRYGKVTAAAVKAYGY